MAVLAKDVERVAELANIELTADEKSRMLRDLNSILDYVAQLNELETASVAPMAQVAEQLSDESKALESDLAKPLSALRSDDLVPSLERDQVLACAPDTDRVFFRVPKVIER